MSDETKPVGAAAPDAPAEMSREDARIPASLRLPKEYPVDGMAVAEAPPACWWCRCTRLCCSPCCEKHSQPCAVRFADCAVNYIAWRSGMFVGSPKFERDVIDKIFKRIAVPTGVDAKVNVRSTDIKVPSQHVAGLEIPVRVFEPITGAAESTESKPVLLFLHEGGWTFMRPTLKSVHDFCSQLAIRTKCIVVAPSYRLAPEHVFPAALEDCFDVFVYLTQVAQHPSEGALKHADVTSGISVGGCSAGGQLSLVLGTLIRDGLKPDLTPMPEARPTVPIKRLVLLQAALMMDRYVENNGKRWSQDAYFLDKSVFNFFYQSYVPGKDLQEKYSVMAKDRRLSPILAGFKGLPRTIVTCSDQDPLQPQQLVAYDHLRNSGVSTELWGFVGQVHAFHAHPTVPAAQQLLDFLEVEFKSDNVDNDVTADLLESKILMLA